MARLMAAPVTPLPFATMSSSWLPHANKRPTICNSGTLAPFSSAGALGLLAGQPQDSVRLPLERGKIHLHAVEHRAPVAHDGRHGDGFAHFLLGRAVGLGGSRVEIHAVVARNLRGDR